LTAFYPFFFFLRKKKCEERKKLPSVVERVSLAILDYLPTDLFISRKLLKTTIEFRQIDRQIIRIYWDGNSDILIAFVREKATFDVKTTHLQRNN